MSQHDKATEVQRRSFTKWINKQLRKGGFEEEVSDLEEEQKTGIILMKTISAATGGEIPPHNKKCKSEIHCVSNQGIVIDMFKKAKIKLVGIGPQDLADGDTRAVLAAVWAIIYAQQIGAIQGEEASGKAGLLLWVKRATASYDDVDVRDFKKSWASGKALAALIHKFKPNVLSFDAVEDLSPLQRIEKCITVAQEDLGVDPLIDAADMEQAIDEKAVMTYISEFFVAFSKVQDAEVAQRRVAKFFETQRAIDGFREDYEKKGKDLLVFVEEQLPKLQEEVAAKGLLNCKDLLDEANAFRSGDLAEYRREKANLEGIMSSLQTTLSCHQRTSYKPPKGLELETINEAWKTLEAAAEAFVSERRERYVKYKERQSRKYKELTENLAERLADIDTELQGLEGNNPKKLLRLLGAYKEATEEMTEEIEAGVKLQDQLTKAGVNLDDIVGLLTTIDDIERTHVDLLKNLKRKEGILTRELEALKGKAVSDNKLAEIKETFDLFDSNKSESLSPEDFNNALKGLGRNLSDKETAALFKSSCADGSEMSFDEFVEVMTKMESDADTPEAILSSVSALQKDAAGLTVEDLVSALGKEAAEYFAEKIPSKNGKLDIHAYLKECYGESS